MSTCKSCGAPIRWVLLCPRVGDPKPHPLDAAPADDGTITITGKRDGETLAEVTPREQLGLFGADGAARYRSHFSTCPQAAQHRSKP